MGSVGGEKMEGMLEDGKPVDAIREMNPGKDIPTGAEMAERIKETAKEEKVCSCKDRKDALEMATHYVNVKYCAWCGGRLEAE